MILKRIKIILVLLFFQDPLLANTQFFEEGLRFFEVKKFEKAKSFFLENGHLSPGRNFPEIMGWVSKQRAAYKKGKLSKDKAEKLESIKIVWDPRKKFN